MKNKECFYKLVKFPIGWVGICGSKKGVSHIQLPEKNKQETEALLLKKAPSAQKTIKGPQWMSKLERKLHNLFSSKNTSLQDIPIDIDVTPFQRRVYSELRKVSFGSILTYKDLAIKIKAPQSARAIGMAMGKNPIPLVVPCHRVVSSSKHSLGGFSAYRGVDLKKQLLIIEKNDTLSLC